jgi:hypothetical protein
MTKRLQIQLDICTREGKAGTMNVHEVCTPKWFSETKKEKKRERNHVLDLFPLQMFLLTSFSCPVDCTHIKG